MGAATTQVARHSLLNLFASGPGIPVQQRFRRHDHSIGAIAALGRGFGDERSLHRVRLFRST